MWRKRSPSCAAFPWPAWPSILPVTFSSCLPRPRVDARGNFPEFAMDTCAMTTRFPVAPQGRAAGFWLVVMIASLLALFAGTAGAAAPKDWWVNVTNDRADEVRKQLARGADPNVVDAEGLPSIMLAIREGSWAVYDVLAANKR